jgi:hypothetical protein
MRRLIGKVLGRAPVALPFNTPLFDKTAASGIHPLLITSAPPKYKRG